jgi:hypothetical protein
MIFIGEQCDEPDPELAVMLAQLAYCLLKDKQYKLGRELLGTALSVLEPQSLSDMLRQVYADFHASVHDMRSPLLSQIRKRRAT